MFDTAEDQLGAGDVFIALACDLKPGMEDVVVEDKHRTLAGLDVHTVGFDFRRSCE